MRLRTRELPVFPVASAPVRPDVDPGVRAVDPRSFELGPEDGPRLGVVTLGCDKNTVDSEHMMAALVSAGARITSDVESAEVVVVNTCGFIDVAKEQSIDTILNACALKERGQVRAVAAVGCMVQRYREELEREIPEVDLFLGIAEMSRLVPELRTRGYIGDDFIPTMERPLRVLATETRHVSFLKVSEGCDHRCAFCAIPHMRGLHRSADLESLVAEARALGEKGVRELNLVSQDTTWYGRDLWRHDRSAPLLQDLLEALLDGTGVDWYRLLYMYPSGITPDLVSLLAREPRLLPYLDMPLQHGSDRILTRMRRPERQATIRERVRWLRDSIDDLTLRTTVIVGFPGETDADVREMMDFLEEIRFDRVGAFAYSIEEGTAAAAMPDQVPDEVKAERLELVMERQREISYESNSARIGCRELVLVDSLTTEEEGCQAVGRSRGQAPEVDGRTWLKELGRARPGDIVEVEIVDADDYDLTGRVLLNA
ncbi:MAG: 30S ribosomal protein S12 methylthiotransferase RimO [Gemmatimonadetes bacterium]|nr:30S ribosomal protein S12 methylthiotransferase RimO [Gemmatimonadota bacterium]MCY3612277.1 30S ribosomal protein S12 methylthiotransferase RimO [Gemmatimonadota bacterium]MCY3678817.1 30S ribosomal protein S12 methylthiotransferase RimO [Gemmatimonadota bacterium]MYA41988.1 30S ribosomal protein S12 methylthiotransferase RimO [Gemmatimonadota bacterium]MYE94905.1 30S ribosomal protein S12 methylthiotransferase RimO [Gemmatimonadota bacterium]